MQLAELSKSPELIKISLDDEATIKEFGEALEFYTFDRQPMDVFMSLAGASTNDPTKMITALKPMILDQDGKEVIKDDKIIPSHILIRVYTKLVARLGN
jgi:hypothetical protein